MPETPVGYWPEYQWLSVPTKETPSSFAGQHVYEVDWGPCGPGQRRQIGIEHTFWSGATRHLNKTELLEVLTFIAAHPHLQVAFYLFRPLVESVTDYACGSVSDSATFTLPLRGAWWKTQTPQVSGITTIKVAGVSKAFTLAANIGAGGEERATFTAGNQTGAVTVTGDLIRLRKIVLWNAESVGEDAIENALSLLTSVPIAFVERGS